MITTPKKSEDSGAGVVRDKKLCQLIAEEDNDEDAPVNLPELIKERKRTSPWDDEILVYGNQRIAIKEKKK